MVGTVGIATEKEQGLRMGIGIVVREGEGRQEVFSRSGDIPPIELQMSRQIKPAQPIVLGDRAGELLGVGHEKALFGAGKIPFFAIGIGNGKESPIAPGALRIFRPEPLEESPAFDTEALPNQVLPHPEEHFPLVPAGWGHLFGLTEEGQRPPEVPISPPDGTSGLDSRTEQEGGPLENRARMVFQQHGHGLQCQTIMPSLEIASGGPEKEFIASGVKCGRKLSSAGRKGCRKGSSGKGQNDQGRKEKKGEESLSS
jgi:hypothetical protein